MLRAEQRWSGLASGVLSRAVRFTSSLLIATFCLRTFGAELWGVAVVASASAELLYYLDFALPELCAFEAAQTSTREVLRRRLGRTLGFAIVPIGLGSTAFGLCAELVRHDILPAQHSHLVELAQMLWAAAIAYPFVIFANIYAGTLQGLGRLREMNTMHGVSGIVELVAVAAAIYFGQSLVMVQWWRAAAHAARCVLFALAFKHLDLALARPTWPDAEERRSILRYCVGSSVGKALGNAMFRITPPIAQLFTESALIGAYDAVDRLGNVLQRAANPVSDLLFQRLVRAFVSSEEQQREKGRQDFLAGTALLVAFSACTTLCTVSLAPWLFPIWLGSSLAPAPIAFAPWVLASWSLNLSTGMCTSLLLARARFSECNWAHGVGVTLNATTLVVLGLYDGRLALMLGPVVGNLALSLGLARAGCRAAALSPASLVLRACRLWTPVVLAFLVQKFLPTEMAGLGSALSLSALGCLGVLLLLSTDSAVRALAREFEASPGRHRVAETP